MFQHIQKVQQCIWYIQLSDDIVGTNPIFQLNSNSPQQMAIFLIHHILSSVQSIFVNNGRQKSNSSSVDLTISICGGQLSLLQFAASNQANAQYITLTTSMVFMYLLLKEWLLMSLKALQYDAVKIYTPSLQWSPKFVNQSKLHVLKGCHPLYCLVTTILFSLWIRPIASTNTILHIWLFKHCQ